MTLPPVSTFIALDGIDIPNHLADIPPVSSAEVRAYRSAMTSAAPTPNPLRDTPISGRLEPTGRYTAVAGVRRILMARSAGATVILAAVERSHGQ